MPKHFDVDILKSRIESIADKFKKKQYFAANDAATELYKDAVDVFTYNNISEILLECLTAVQADMRHAYDHSNCDQKTMVAHLKYACTKSNKNNVTESPAVLAAKANAKTKKKKGKK